MAMRSTLRLLWQCPLSRFALIAFLLMGAAAWYVMAPGGWVNALHLPPVLDASTPRSQNGFTLEDITTPGDDDRGDAAILLIRPSTFPHLAAQYQNSEGLFVYGSNFGSRTPQLQASAQTSNGDVTPLAWKIIGTQVEPQFYRVEIPGGYSNDCRYMNVTVVPSLGPFPRWRITRLSNMRHVISDASKITSSVTSSGIITTAGAWRGRHKIFLRVRPALPPDSHQWELATNDQWSEWEQSDRPHPQGATTRLPILGRAGVFTEQDMAYGGGLTMSFDAPYRSASRYVRADCELHQFETYDERVTFRNVAVKQDPDDVTPSRDKTYLGLTQLTWAKSNVHTALDERSQSHRR